MAQVVGDGDWLHCEFELCNIINYNTNVAEGKLKKYWDEQDIFKYFVKKQ